MGLAGRRGMGEEDGAAVKRSVERILQPTPEDVPRLRAILHGLSSSGGWTTDTVLQLLMTSSD